MATYDPSEVQDCANRLYGIARAIVASETVLGVLVGGVAAGAVADLNGWGAGIGALVGVVVGGIAGYQDGLTRSTHHRLRAQEVLCLVAIETAMRAVRTGQGTKLEAHPSTQPDGKATALPSEEEQMLK